MRELKGLVRYRPPLFLMNKHYETKFGEPFPETLALPFVNALPTDAVGLLKVRIYIRKRCLHDLEFRRDITRMCALDVPFFILIFGWFHETRGTEDQIGEFPALLDPDQIDILAVWQKYVGTTDITVEKSRGVGLSYLAVSLMMWLWLFNPHGIDLGLLTKELLALDRRDRPGSLMGKLDLLFKKLPAWMRLDDKGETILYRTSSNDNHKFSNLLNSNTITGYLPTNDKLRSDRLYLLIADEGAFLPIEDQKWLAAAYGTVNAIIWISTHQGTANVFYRMTKDTQSRLIRMSTWWWNNRRCRRGMYHIQNGQVKFLDPDYKYPMDYFSQPWVFGMEKWIKGRKRSPWTDRYFSRSGIDAITLLEELYGLSAIFDRRLIRQSVIDIAKHTVKRPMARGDIINGEWIDIDDGPIRLWLNPNRRDGVYTLGADPGLSSLGGDYKAASAFDNKTGEQILAGRWINIDPVQFAEKMAEVGHWLSGARGSGFTSIAFESTGVGVVFKGQILRMRYPSLCCPPGKDQPGFPTSRQEDKEDRLLEFGRAILTGDYIVRDSDLVVELPAFEFNEKFELVYSLSDGHGDSATASSLSWQGGKARRIAYKEANATMKKRELEESRPRFRVWSDQFR